MHTPGLPVNFLLDAKQVALNHRGEQACSRILFGEMDAQFKANAGVRPDFARRNPMQQLWVV
ncbi:hypothetical protein DSO57_1030877 [Entomophthora muscae]|uniref:Uncharacterized protein n=1 Tax=Entomophthora muscae TaxID=34485 RepID=A0ACC2TYQ0_9FUNG|nr:hypothetical protein DSO57_1030877 [Entomophthora muscae]